MPNIKSNLLLLTLWAFTFTASGQVRPPGGVHGIYQWYSTDTSLNKPGLRSRLAGNNSFLSFDHALLTSLNFHPALSFTGIHSISIDLGVHDLRSATYFTVYQSTDTSNENSIWHITDDQKTRLVLTTDRMADMSAYRYMNYIDVIRTQPKVNIYVQNKEKDTVATTNQRWSIGTKPVNPQLPVMNFKGYIPEIMAYDRVLNSTERLRVASSLALKYGITLTEPAATYLNSAGEKIWDGYDYPQWHRNIAGLCRDDSAGLYQTRATSSNMTGLLTISSRDTLHNNSFLLWGENGKPLAPGPKQAGLPTMLQKTWLMKTYGNRHPFATDLVIDTKPVDAPLSFSPVYWLAIDRGGEGKFNASGMEFVKMDKLDGEGRAHFANVIWDTDGSGKDVWGIIAGQELLLAATIRQPGCSTPGTGSLDIKILGGRGPFQFSLHNGAGLFITRQVNDGMSPVSFSNLATGKYFLKVNDAGQHSYTDSFYINNEDAPTPLFVEDSYTLPAGRPLQLDAAAGMPDGLSWEWSGPGNFHSFNPQVNITVPGLYTLHCSKNGCINTRDVIIKEARANILYDVTVFPNPTRDVFYARVRLDKPAPVTMFVYGSDGKLLFTRQGDGRANYLFTGHLNTSGLYEVVFTSGLSKTNKRLVIVK